MRCRNMADIGRRQFLRGSAFAAAGAVAATALPAQASAQAQGQARINYPSNLLANITDLKVNEPLDVSYPDADAPGVLLKLGTRIDGGAGPDRDIVGFTTICPHKGFPLTYNAADRSLGCSGHYSKFDPEKGGLQIWGHATQNLPQYTLRVDDNGDVYAEGLDELLYGRLSNVLV